MTDDEEGMVTLAELEEGMRALGVSRALRRRALSDVREVTRALVADGCMPDRVRYRASICEDCGALSITTGGPRRSHLH